MSDETVVLQWGENAYYQYFCGQLEFTPKEPCDASDLVHFRKRIGEKLQIDIVGGTDFPQDLTPYSLVIHCGACMFNRKYVLSRIDRARCQHIPMTNYGVAIACLNGILDKIVY